MRYIIMFAALMLVLTSCADAVSDMQGDYGLELEQCNVVVHAQGETIYTSSQDSYYFIDGNVLHIRKGYQQLYNRMGLAMERQPLDGVRVFSGDWSLEIK